MIIDKQKTPKDILKDIINTLSHTSRKKKEFWYYWKNDEDFYNSFKKELLDLHNFLKKSVYSEYIPHTKDVNKIILSIINLMKELNELYENADKPKGFFKKIKSKKAIDLGNKKLSELNSKIDDLCDLMKEISEKYPTKLEDKKKILLAKFPYLYVSTYEDYIILSHYEKENVFESKLFISLDKHVLRYFRKMEGISWSHDEGEKPWFSKKKIHLTRINLLLRKLSDPKKYKIYFYNLARFRRWYDYDWAEKAPIYDEMMFFDNMFFDMCESWNEFFRIINAECVGELFYFRNWLIENRKSGKNILNDLAYKSLKKLSTTNIKVEYRALIGGGSPILLRNLTEGIIDLLVLFKIRKLHNVEEIKLFKDMFDLSQKHNDFKKEKLLLTNIWNNTIEKSARDLNHMDIFLKLYYKLGSEFFNKLVEKRIVLSSSEIHDLEVKIEFDSQERLDPESLILDIRKRSKNKRLVFVAVAKVDWNLALTKTYPSLKGISKEKFEFHFAFITSTNQLALLIKNVAKKKKIDIILIAGHGNPSGTLFSYQQNGVLNKNSLNSRLFNGIKKCFSKGAVCYLSSCSTGKGEENIAKEVSKRFGIKTFAPTVNTSGRILNKPDGNFVIEVGFSNTKIFSPNE